MAFNDAYRESIQTKHIANVGFTSTAKGVTNEAYASKNPHQVVASQIPAVNVIASYGPLVADGISAGLVEKHTVKFTADPTVNDNKAWISYEEDCIESGHSERGHIRLDQFMRYAETQYKLRVFQDNGAGAPDYTKEILPSEVNFNWEYDASSGIIYFDANPGATKTLPIWGEFYIYVGKSVEDGLGATTSGIDELVYLLESHYDANSTDHDNRYYTHTEVNSMITTLSGAIESQNEFIELIDTISEYNEGRILFESSDSVTDDNNFIYSVAEQTLKTPNVEVSNNLSVAGDVTISGSIGFDDGNTVNEIITTIGSDSTDDQLSTSKAVYDFTNSVSGTLNQAIIDGLSAKDEFIELTDTISSYNAGRILFESSDSVVDDAGLVFVENTLIAPNFYTDGDVTLSGSLTFVDSESVNIDEFVTYIDDYSTDSQVPTAKSVFDLTNTVSGILQGSINNLDGGLNEAIIWEVVDTPYDQIRPKIEHQGKAVYTYGSLTIGGDLTVSGTTTTIHSEELTVSDKIITVNAGEVGAGLTGERYAGIEVDRGSEENYFFVYDEVENNFRVGISGSLQAVATREDDPTDQYIAFWNAAEYRFDTEGGISVHDIASQEYVTTAITTLSGILQEDINGTISDLANNYYNKSELDNGQLDNRYYTENEVNTLLQAQDEFIELIDTISSYTDGRILFTTASGVVDNDNLTFDSSTGTLSINYLQLESGDSVNEIVSTVTSGSLGTQIPTAEAVWNLTEAAAAAVHMHADVDAVYVDDKSWTYGDSFTEVPDNVVIFVNGVKQRIGSSYDCTYDVPGGVFTITFNYNVYSSDWVSIMYTYTS
jgi:hypothetical protein